MLLVVLVLACACGGAGASAALGAHARSAHTRTHARPHHSPSCAQSGRSHKGRHHTHKASYRGGHRSRHRSHCVRRHGLTHRAGTHHRSNSPGHSRNQIHRSSAAGCADADLPPSTQNVERVRAAVMCLVNRERAGHGESALQQNPRVEQAAQSHTESMAFGNYFEHVGPRGDTPLSRLRASGYIYSSQVGYEIAENIGWGTLSQGTPRAIVAAWMNSPGHRANILDAHFRDTAIGVSPHVPSSVSGGQPGGIYTQDFGVIITG
jgi:uncharacterized protein YkwD